MMPSGSDYDSSPQPNRLSSPTHECPVFANLSPLKPQKAQPYRQLFTSPNSELTVFRDAHSNHANDLHIPKEIKSQQCSATAIAQPKDDADADAATIQVKPLSSHQLDETKRADQLSSDLSNTKQPIAEGNRGSIMLNGTEYNVQGTCPSSNDYISCRPHSNISSISVDGMDTNQTQCGIRRRLDFDTENCSGRCNIYTSTYNKLPAGSGTSHIVCDAQEKENLSNVQAIRVKRKRKRVSVSEGEGCKQCNCKRSKCLKLYCECFASGIYCLDSCACANCYNKPEYEDTVHDARQQIESRNPHAFAPKVVPRNTITITNTNTNTIEQDIKWTSGRHKRGCNCKKSKCLKKYCECYQSKVGCSDGCRCDNCHNSFGTKTEAAYGRVGRWKNESHNAGQAYTDSIKAMGLGGAQLPSSTWQQVDNFAPSAPPCSEVALYSATSTLWNYAQASQTQFGIETRFLPHGSFNWPYPLNICTQQLQTSEVLSHDYSQHEDITEDDNIYTSDNRGSQI